MDSELLYTLGKSLNNSGLTAGKKKNKYNHGLSYWKEKFEFWKT